MTQAKLYGNPASFRTQKVLAAAALAGKQVALTTGTAPGGPVPHHVLPALVEGKVHLAGEDAIATHLLGGTLSAEVLQWVSYGQQRVQPDVLAYVLPSVSAAKVDNHTLTTARKELLAELHNLDLSLKSLTFLVNNRLSYADISLALDLLPAFQHVLTQKEREQYVNVTRWFNTIVHQAPVKSILGDVTLATTVAEFDNATHEKLVGAGKKHDSKPAAPKAEKPAAEKPKKEKKEKEPEDDDTGAPPEPKFVDPLAALPAGSFAMDPWKRVYSNEDTATKAIPYFWENFDPANYSIWYAEYKFPQDLTLSFMSCNLITGMFTRLEKLRKHAFGSVLLFGTDNNSTISGVWVWRGQELVFPLCPDWTIDYESYDWKKLDPASEETKKLVNEYWLWEGDFGGKKFNQGKIFK